MVKVNLFFKITQGVKIRRKKNFDIFDSEIYNIFIIFRCILKK
jgi:hypothetical protein